MKKIILLSLIIFIIGALLFTPFFANATSSYNKYEYEPLPTKQMPKYKGGEVLVKYKSSKLKLIKLDSGTSVEEALTNLRADSRVVYAEPNYIRQLLYVPNDTWMSKQWGLRNTGQLIAGKYGTAGSDIDAANAWDIEKGDSNSVTIAVIDTGIELNHTDLNSNIWTNSDETAANGIDDDGNGYVDDRNGYNWIGISQASYNDTFELGKSSSPNSTAKYTTIAQSLTGKGQVLSAIGFMIKRVGLPTSNISVSVRQGAVAGPEVSTLTIYRYEVDEEYFGGVSERSEIYKSLDTPVTLTNGTKYYIVLSVSDSHDTRYYELPYWHSNSSVDYLDPYVEGEALAYDNDTSTWINNLGTAVTDITYPDDFYFVTNPQSNVYDDHGHGTHVAGIAAAETNNGTGVAGVSSNAKIMPLKAADASGVLYDSNIISAINYATNNGADIINMSFGGEGNSQAIQDAIDNAYEHGVTPIASAGNSGDDTVYYPASNNKVISVSATDNDDLLATFSTYNSYVDVSAPGKGIVSALPTYYVTLKSLGYDYLYGDYDFLSGTSMASPMVAGTAALIKSKFPSYTPAQVEMLLRLGDDLGASGKDSQFGYGRLNAYKSLLGDQSNPSTPTIASSTHAKSSKYYSNNDPTFSWSSTDNLGVKGYSYALNRTKNTTPTGLDTTSNSKHYTNIKNGLWYFHVRAIDYFNNYSSTAHFKIHVDTYKPKTFAPRSARVRLGKAVRLYYKVFDPYTKGKARVKLVIRRNGKKYGTKNLGTVSINKIKYSLFKPSRTGVYTYYVYATDLAGNRQRNVARNRVVCYKPASSGGGGSTSPSPTPTPSPSPSPIPSPPPIPLPIL